MLECGQLGGVLVVCTAPRVSPLVCSCNRLYVFATLHVRECSLRQGREARARSRSSRCRIDRGPGDAESASGREMLSSRSLLSSSLKEGGVRVFRRTRSFLPVVVVLVRETTFISRVFSSPFPRCAVTPRARAPAACAAVPRHARRTPPRRWAFGRGYESRPSLASWGASHLRSLGRRNRPNFLMACYRPPTYYPC